MPAIHTYGPGPSKPLAVTLGVGGGGFGEKVPPSAKVIKNGLKSIGVLEVEEDFGDFVKVDGHYWNKEVAPFVGERVSNVYFFHYPVVDLAFLVYCTLRPLQASWYAVPQILD